MPAKPNDPGSHDAALEPGLELPVDSRFLPVRLPVSPESILAISASYLPRFVARPEFWKERAEQRCLVEFDLDHPERAPGHYPAEFLERLFQGAGSAL